MEIKEKVIKVYTLELTELEALDLRGILFQDLEEWSIEGSKRALVNRLKLELGEI